MADRVVELQQFRPANQVVKLSDSKLCHDFPDFLGNKVEEVDDVFLTDLSWSDQTILELTEFCHRMQINFSFVPGVFTAFRTDLRSFPSGLAILEVKHTPLEGWGRIMKRAVDIIGLAMP